MAEQTLTNEWAALAGTSAKTYNLQNLGRYKVHFTTGATAPAAGTVGKILFPLGHYLSVGAATPSTGESIWVISEGADPAGLIEYS